MADTISILIGNGDGSFTETSEFPLGDYPHMVAVGLVNGDLYPDMVVASAHDSTVYYLEGNGDGSFDPAVAVLNDPTNAEWCQTVALGDLNQDGNLDLVSGNYKTNNISVLLGNGTGAFGTPAHYITDETPGNIGGRVTIADLNKDWKADLIIGNESSGDITVLLNNGDGTFNDATAADRYPAGTSPVEIVAGDFDGDRNVDLAVCSYGADDDVYVYPGVGNGTFDSGNVQTIDAGNDSWGMTGGVLDSGTRVDLAVTANGDGQVVVLLNQVEGRPTWKEGFAAEASTLGTGNMGASDIANTLFMFIIPAGAALFWRMRRNRK